MKWSGKLLLPLRLPLGLNRTPLGSKMQPKVGTDKKNSNIKRRNKMGQCMLTANCWECLKVLIAKSKLKHKKCHCEPSQKVQFEKVYSRSFPFILI